MQAKQPNSQCANPSRHPMQTCGCKFEGQPKQHDIGARQKSAEQIPLNGPEGMEEGFGQEAGDFMLEEEQSPRDPDQGIDAAGKDAEIRSSPRKTEPLEKFRSGTEQEPGRGER